MENLEQKHLALLQEAQRRGQPNSQNLRLSFEILSLSAAIDRACALRLAPHRLSEGKFVLLFLLHDLPDGLSPHELADKAGVTRATVTGLLDGLERDGFLTRHRGHDDRRKITVRLTTMGQTIAQQLFDQHTAWIATLFAGFDAGERAVLDVLLQKVWRNLMVDPEEVPT